MMKMAISSGKPRAVAMKAMRMMPMKMKKQLNQRQVLTLLLKRKAVTMMILSGQPRMKPRL